MCCVGREMWLHREIRPINPSSRHHGKGGRLNQMSVNTSKFDNVLQGNWGKERRSRQKKPCSQFEICTSPRRAFRFVSMCKNSNISKCLDTINAQRLLHLMRTHQSFWHDLLVYLLFLQFLTTQILIQSQKSPDRAGSLRHRYH